MIDAAKKNEILQNFRLLTNYIAEIPTVTSCLDCASWDHKSDKCTKFNMIPPPKVIVKKCDEFELDIPF